MFKSLFLIPIFIFLLQCENDSVSEDCSAVTCYVETLHLQLIDQNSNENLLENDTYIQDDIAITDNNSNAIPFSIVSSSFGQAIQILLTSTRTELLNYTFTIKNKTTFNSTISIEKTGEGNFCCGIKKEVTSITVTGIENEINLSKKTIMVFLE
tara:strand:+ start:39360 stop:39821 length:462 start_codon:yes stop_codon:yes gene_type:complete